MWFNSKKRTSFKDSVRTNRKSLTDITCDLVNGLKVVVQGGSVKSEPADTTALVHTGFKTSDSPKPIVRMDEYERPRSIVAGTKPFRFMIEATVEVRPAIEPN